MSDSIGGFFEVHDGYMQANSSGISVMESWTKDKHSALFSSARSIIHQLRNELQSHTLWIPEIFCDVFENSSYVKSYLLEEDSFNPNIKFLEEFIDDGDVVLVVDFYGTEVSPAFRSYAESRSLVFWIQDACHNLSPSFSWADFTIFSPRKLFGVTDGGVIVQNTHKSRKIDFLKWKVGKSDLIGSLSPLLRKFAPEYNSLFQLYRSEENAINEELMKVSDFTEWQLNHIAIESLIRKRRENFGVLYSEFGDYLPPGLTFNPNGTPFGFPLYIENRDQVQKRLIEERIFPAIHWINNAKDKTVRQIHHERLQLTIPCDQRYDLEDMHKISKTLKKQMIS